MNGRGDCIAIAHRGFRGMAPENTMAAARRGLESGAPWWELDVAASADGELVVMHDDSLARTTDARERFPARAPWSVYDFSSSELATLDAGSWFERDDPFGTVASGLVGASELAGYRGLRVPTLSEALEFTARSGWSVNVEIKDASGRPCDAWLPERVAEAVAAAGLAGRCLVSSFNHSYLERVKAARQELPTGALVDEAPADPAGLLRRLGAASLNPGLAGLSRRSVEETRAAGYAVYVWTVNEEADMRRLVEWGASGLFTDFPDRLLRVLGGEA